jgi:hypothetical protein
MATKAFVIALFAAVLVSGNMFLGYGNSAFDTTNGWEHAGAPKPETRHSVSIQLHAPGLETLRKIFHQEIYNSEHARYRQYLTPDQVREVLAVP